MAGGGDVRIIGANLRVGEGVANVTDHALWVHIASAGSGIIINVEGAGEEMPLSGSTLGAPINVTATPVTIHTPIAGFRDFLTVFVGNNHAENDEMIFTWQNGETTTVFAPSNETVVALIDIPIEDGESLEAAAGNPFEVQDLVVIGKVRRVEV